MATDPHVAPIVETAKRDDRGPRGRLSARWSDLREAAYRRGLEAAGLARHSYARPRRGRARTSQQERDDVARWLAALPDPVSVLAGLLEELLEAQLARVQQMLPRPT